MAKNNKKIEFPSKKEVLDALLKEDNTPDKFDRFVLIVEFKKINPVLGIAKCELFRNHKAVIKGSITCTPEGSNDFFNWSIIKPGQSYFRGFSMSYKGETLFSQFKQGINKSIKEGKIPFLKN